MILLGRIDHDQVPEFLHKGSIYLNTSLTEAFCISIIEAAAVGLLVVSTKVGGIPEVLPPDMMRLAEPDARSLVQCLDLAIRDIYLRHPDILPPDVCHKRVKDMYSWENVAMRTEVVYRRAFAKATPSLRDLAVSSYGHCGFFSRIFMVTLLLLDLIMFTVCEFFQPAEELRKFNVHNLMQKDDSIVPKAKRKRRREKS